MARTNKRQRIQNAIHQQKTVPFNFNPPKPEPLPKWSRIKTLWKLGAFRQNKLPKEEIAPLFQNLIWYKVVRTLPAWEQRVAERLIQQGICTR